MGRAGRLRQRRRTEQQHRALRHRGRASSPPAPAPIQPRSSPWADNRNGVYEIYVARLCERGLQRGSSPASGCRAKWIVAAAPSTPAGRVSRSTPPATPSSPGRKSAAAQPTSTPRSTTPPPTAAHAGGWVADGHVAVRRWAFPRPATRRQCADGKHLRRPGCRLARQYQRTCQRIFVRQFNGTTWAAAGAAALDTGTGISGSSTNIPGFSLANNGTTEAIAWTQPGTTAGNSIYLKQNSGSGWAAINEFGVDDRHQRRATPRACQASPITTGAFFAAWAAVIGGTTNIAAVTNTALGVERRSPSRRPRAAAPARFPRGRRTPRCFRAAAASLELAWVEDRLIGTTNSGGGDLRRPMPAARSSASSPATPASTESSIDPPPSPVPGRSLAVDGSGHPVCHLGRQFLRFVAGLCAWQYAQRAEDHLRQRRP